MNLIIEFIYKFLAVVIEALPFILIGSLISAVIQIYVNDETIKKILPKNNVLALVIASVAGLFFPMCECAIIPVTNSLIKKGLPLGVATTFMLAVPSINPLVILSTYYAFDNFFYVFFRSILAIICSIAVGLIVEMFFHNESLTLKDNSNYYCNCCNSKYMYLKENKMENFINIASKEFLNVIAFVILGAFVSSFISTLVDINKLSLFNNNIVNIVFMMALSFLLSLCSEADAFIAKGFAANFTSTSIMAFLLVGPMMDLKNTIVSLGYFNKKYTFLILTSIFTIIFAMTCLLSMFL